MVDNFADHNEFDKYAREHGGWFYDNAWGYHDQSFDCYAGSEYSDNNGELNRLVMLANCPMAGLAVVLQVKGWTQTEVWTGPVRTKADVDALQVFVKA
jgi:hypothetical protein